jgi:hypothetical protein
VAVGVTALVSDTESNDDLRWRDRVAGNAQAPLPEPWFIREARERAGPASPAATARAPAPLPEPDLRDDASPVAMSARVAETVPTGPRSAPWRIVAIATLIIAAVIVVWLTAMPKVGGAPPVAALPEDAAASTITTPVTLDCASPATIARLRDIIVGQARQGGGGRDYNLDARAVGLSVSVAAAPDLSSGDGRTLACRGTLSLPQSGDLAPVAVQIAYGIRPTATGVADVTGLRGAAPIVATLIRPMTTPDDLSPVPSIAEPVEPLPQEVASQPQVERLPDARTPIPNRRPFERPPEARAPTPVPLPAPPPEPRFSNPSFDCRRVTSRVLEAVCASPALAALDVEMAALFFDVRAGSDAETRVDLDATRDDFIARRQSCRDNACVARVYRERIGELETYR